MERCDVEYNPVNHVVAKRRSWRYTVCLVLGTTLLATLFSSAIILVQLGKLRPTLVPDATVNTIHSYSGTPETPVWTQKTHLGFDEIFAINLDSRRDRLDHLVELAGFLRFNFTRVRAVTAEEAPNENGPSTHRACWKSHMLVYRKIATDPKLQNALILEDDIDMEFDIQYLAHQALETLNSYDSNWDMFYIGHCSGIGEVAEENVINKETKLYRSSNPVCTHGYAVSKRGAQKLVKLLEVFTDPLDIMLINAVKERKANSYSLGKAAIIQYHFDGDYSDINMDGQTSTTGDAVNISARKRLEFFSEALFH